MLECLRSAFAAYEDQYTREAFRDTVPSAEGLERRFGAMTVLVAETRDGAIVGTVSYQRVSPEEAHVRGMAVLPSWHGRGAAQALMERVETDARAAGCAALTLDTTEPLRRAIRFYERNGFRPTGRVTDFFGMPLYEYRKPLI